MKIGFGCKWFSAFPCQRFLRFCEANFFFKSCRKQIRNQRGKVGTDFMQRIETILSLKLMHHTKQKKLELLKMKENETTAWWIVFLYDSFFRSILFHGDFSFCLKWKLKTSFFTISVYTVWSSVPQNIFHNEMCFYFWGLKLLYAKCFHFGRWEPWEMLTWYNKSSFYLGNHFVSMERTTNSNLI